MASRLGSGNQSWPELTRSILRIKRVSGEGLGLAGGVPNQGVILIFHALKPIKIRKDFAGGDIGCSKDAGLYFLPDTSPAMCQAAPTSPIISPKG